LYDRAHARLVAWEAGPEVSRWVGEHTGYARLDPPVLHRREVAFDRLRRVVVVTDWLVGRGEHDLEGAFPLPDQHARMGTDQGKTQPPQATKLEMDLERTVEIGSPDRPAAWLGPLGASTLRAQLVSAWRSPCYGTVQPALRMRFLRRARLP